jgi:redox-sensitive bicupin YhaK (pirin superfamily)
MGEQRKISKILKNRSTMEGAGVHLKRVFGYHEVPKLDPFLLLDDFGSDNPDDYMAGFPWHPHRGIETVTYMLQGEVEHGDSIGNQGVIKSGDVQWMTAGNGIIHQEMPKRFEGYMRGFQLWVNLPSSDKMMNPRYRDVLKDTIPEVTPKNGIKIKIISGEVEGVKGPVQDLVVDTEYLDVTLKPNTEFRHPTKSSYKCFAYVVEGEGSFDSGKKKALGEGQLIIYEEGDEVIITASETPMRFLLISGKPLGEPVAWYGPIVMNTEEELDLAFREYREGTFIKYNGKG